MIEIDPRVPRIPTQTDREHYARWCSELAELSQLTGFSVEQVEQAVIGRAVKLNFGEARFTLTLKLMLYTPGSALTRETIQKDIDQLPDNLAKLKPRFGDGWLAAN